jgi:tRNA nucleotidyltransferase (CCA-adding enzyme)
MVMTLSSKLKGYLPQQIFTLLQDIGVQADAMGHNIFLVGGIVRDLFLKRTNYDFDAVVEGDAVKLAQKLSQRVQVKATIHRRFGTAKLKFNDFSLDIATARREQYIRPGALPDIQPGSIADDLFRRDFSVNAMALCLTPGRFGELIDNYNGQEDIKKKFIRVLHSNSFVDDATRIFRAIRYEQRLGFTIEPQTVELLSRDLSMIDSISGDRLRHELMLILAEEYPERMLLRAGELGVLRKLRSSLEASDWLSEKFEQARQLEKHSSLELLYLCLFIYALSIRENEQFMARLNFPKKVVQAMNQTLQLKAKLRLLTKHAMKPSDIYRFLHNYMPQAIQAHMLASQYAIVKEHSDLYLNRLRYLKPQLNGNDIKEMGVPAGQTIGKVLVVLHKAKLNGELRTRQDEKKLVYRWLRKL